MDEILNLPIDRIPGITFECSCGRTHTFPMEYFRFGKDALPGVREMVKPHKDKKIFLYADANTDKVAGQRVMEELEKEGCDVQYYRFPEEKDHDLFPDETSLGRILINMRRDTGLFIGVGSGVINDLGKYASMVTGKPHMIVATAPSMDGYVSNSSSITCENKKLSIPTVMPAAVVGDTDILKRAPMDMICSGYGDVLGKITALADWKLSELVAGEYYCETAAELVRSPLDELLRVTDGIQKRDSHAIDVLIQGLVLCGVAMSLVSLSRPASGAEHMLSHYWEMEFHEKGLPVHFHGTKVGIATPIIARVFEKMDEYLPDEVRKMLVPSEVCMDYLKRSGLPTHPKEVGVDRELLVRSLCEAYTVRKRYSILQLAVEKGRIRDIANEIADEYQY